MSRLKLKLNKAGDNTIPPHPCGLRKLPKCYIEALEILEKVRLKGK